MSVWQYIRLSDHILPEIFINHNFQTCNPELQGLHYLLEFLYEFETSAYRLIIDVKIYAYTHVNGGLLILITVT